MSESENVQKVLQNLIDSSQENVRRAKDITGYIDSIDDDNESFKWQLKEERKKNRTLGEAIYFSDTERKSQQKKAETSLLFMLLFGCLMAVLIAYSILNCQ